MQTTLDYKGPRISEFGVVTAHSNVAFCVGGGVLRKWGEGSKNRKTAQNSFENRITVAKFPKKEKPQFYAATVLSYKSTWHEYIGVTVEISPRCHVLFGESNRKASSSRARAPHIHRHALFSLITMISM